MTWNSKRNAEPGNTVISLLLFVIVSPVAPAKPWNRLTIEGRQPKQERLVCSWFITLESSSRRWPLLSLKSNFRYSSAMFCLSNAVNLSSSLQHARVRIFGQFGNVSCCERVLFVWNCPHVQFPSSLLGHRTGVRQGHLHQAKFSTFVTNWK